MPSSVSWCVTTVLGAAFSRAAIAASVDVAGDLHSALGALPVDDECGADDETCSLNALQMRGSKVDVQRHDQASSDGGNPQDMWSRMRQARGYQASEAVPTTTAAAVETAAPTAAATTAAPAAEASTTEAPAAGSASSEEGTGASLVKDPAGEDGATTDASKEEWHDPEKSGEGGGTLGAVPIWHYALNCWGPCGNKAGFCSNYCGYGNACCKYLNSGDPAECQGVRFWPVLTFHTCVRTWAQAPLRPPGEGVDNAPIIFTDPALDKPSDAPLMTFYMYRVQSDENYDPQNQNVGNLGGMLWYLHHEIVYHPKLQRSGTYFATRKTRLEKFKVQVRNTQPLWDLGMKFGVVNAFDSTRCTGPYRCANFAKYGYTVGCENWDAGSPSNFPHSQWNSLNKYKGATWYSLPGPCSSKSLKDKTAECMAVEHGGACEGGGEPTGTANCTYTYEKVGEISIDELEGITSEKKFIAQGGREYDYHTDHGTHMTFWDGMKDEDACQKRIDHADALFRKKYPDLPVLEDPGCDFNKYKFFPDRHMR